MDRREHHRVRLRLSARLRWATPFGQKTEVCETLNVSRDGMLVPCEEAHAAGVPLWVTFPYDPSSPLGQPEILARVVRLQNGNGASASTALTALRFELPPRAVTNGNGYRLQERRATLRRRVALPIRVRLGEVPWFEETMTVDISAEGLLFLSNRECAAGDTLSVSFEPSVAVPWPAATDVRSTIVRVAQVPGSPALAVAISRLPQRQS